ncbi:acyl-CoA dehydrogenase family protein [Mycolicibacterium parafortuitum]|uniref:acyl-CoA oxidase n=1 Tax=Mycolicibacterium parafortuitum TaxID=39692 RepID=A0A375YPB2_MYCPF|nr:acyl-CoA dehydrogenase [Mycolicibacterium parafortuitum]ORB25011.1 acyl-CoA oxidase [Mycolicibacterium parafortuitum]SRX82889.1 acyl-CoA oxidase [Rhodococcus jostii RHA1] [Mycolicibacterium parafortuitum]
MTTTAEHLRNSLDGRFRDVKNRVRQELSNDVFRPHYTPNTVIARTKVAEQMKIMAARGAAEDGFKKEHGGNGDVGAAVTQIEMLAMSDLSLMVKAGVQWGLFGGAIENLGTERHHEAYVKKLISLELLGCFAMTETGHGSDVQSLETTATYDPATQEFVIDSPTPTSRKDYIGGAAETARVAAVFAQLITPDGEKHGVHCFVVPIRDDNGEDLPGVTTSDCHYKGGLPGVDNGRIQFDQVRIPRENLLNKYADVAEDGTYSSPIENPNRRFFTMLGTLIRGRVTVGGSAGAAARVALDIATRYALQRRQFEDPDGGEVLLMDYLVHQRRLFPLIARSYALQFAQNELVAKCHELQTAEDPDPEEQRELESRAAGLKAANTWHATRAIQEAREACGGAGYLAENRLIALKADTDVFTTFEGDNHVLFQLVAKELLTAYADDIKGMSPVEWVRFAANFAGERVLKRTAAQTIMQTILDSREDNEEEGSLFNRGTQVQMFEDREEYMVASVARRLQAKSKEMSAFDAFNSVQDHVLHVAQAHIDRIVLEAFVAGIDACEDRQAREVLGLVCDLYALSVIEEDKAWFVEHRFLSTERAKAVTRGINDRCRRLRPHAQLLVDGFGIPESLRYAEMLHPEKIPDADEHTRKDATSAGVI